MLVVVLEVLIDGQLQVLHIGEAAPANALLTEFAKPALDEIEPGGTCGCVVDVEAAVFCQPRGNTVVFVGAVIVDNHVEVDSAGGLPVELAEKLEILLMTMARHALTDDRSVENIECCKQRGCAVALVVVRYSSTAPLLHRQSRLSPVQRLDLALLINADHQRLIRGIQVKSHDIGEFLDESLVLGQLKGSRPMRLQSVGIPDALDCRRADSLFVGHCPHTPVCGSLRGRLQCRIDDLLDLGGRNPRLPTTPWSVFGQCGWSSLHKAVSPKNDRRATCCHLAGDVTIRVASRGHEHETRAEDYLLRGVTSSNPCLQGSSLLVGYRQWFRSIPHSNVDHTGMGRHCKVICETLH